jgi:hypothetical protein
MVRSCAVGSILGVRMSVAVRLGGFVVLVAVVFLLAFLVGSWVGPVSPVHGGGAGSGMRMSTLFAGSAPGAGAAR